LREERVYKPLLALTLQRCETILMVPEQTPQSISKGSGFPLVEGLGTHFHFHKQRQYSPTSLSSRVKAKNSLYTHPPSTNQSTF